MAPTPKQLILDLLARERCIVVHFEHVARYWYDPAKYPDPQVRERLGKSLAARTLRKLVDIKKSVCCRVHPRATERIEFFDSPENSEILTSSIFGKPFRDGGGPSDNRTLHVPERGAEAVGNRFIHCPV